MNRNPFPDAFAPLASLFLLAMLVLHLSKQVEIDTPALALMALAAAVWLLPLVKKLKIGDVEIELKELQARVEKAEQNSRNLAEGLAIDAAPRRKSLSGQPGAVRPTLLQALTDSPGAFHPPEALAEETGLAPEALGAELDRLSAEGLAVKVSGKGDRALWGATARGRAAAS